MVIPNTVVQIATSVLTKLFFHFIYTVGVSDAISILCMAVHIVTLLPYAPGPYKYYCQLCLNK